MAKILVIDDEPINVKMLSRLLASEGYKVVQAASGLEAIQVVAQESPDLILLDVMMPGMDGFEVCRRLKAMEATRQTPIVMVTALDTLEDKVKGIDAGADDFLTKPYHKIELLARTKSLLKIKALNDQVARSYAQLAEMNAYDDRLFGNFDPSTFDLEASLANVIDRLVRRHPREEEKPEAVFLAVGEFRDVAEGRVYRRVDGAIAADLDPITMPTEALVALSDVGPDVTFSNWSDIAESVEEYQEYQPPQAVAKLGRINNYTSYYSGHVAVVGYNYIKKVGPSDAQVLKALAAHSKFLKTLADQMRGVEDAFFYTVEALARAAEANDHETGNHIVRVNSYCRLVAEELGQGPEFVREITRYAQMHDVGKIHIHPGILRKEGPLTPEEWTEMKRHTEYGARILGDHPRLRTAAQIALHHHERWDGSGYPNGLKGEEIPLAGRITMLADIYDALRSPRSYKPGFSQEKAVDIILNGDNRVMPGHFDPDVLEVFRRRHAEFARIYEEAADPVPEAPPSPPKR